MSRAVHIAGPDLSFGLTRNLALEEDLLAQSRRGRTPLGAPTEPTRLAQLQRQFGNPSLAPKFDINSPSIPPQDLSALHSSYQPPAGTPGFDDTGAPVSRNPDAPIPYNAPPGSAPPSTPGTDAQGRAVSTNPSAATPVAPPAKLPEITNKKIKAIDDEEEGQHQLMLNRQRRRKERDALASTTSAERKARLAQGARENDEGNQAAMKSARKTNPAAFEDDPDQPGRIRGKQRDILSEQYAGQEDNTMGPHALGRIPLQPQPYNASQPSPSSTPPPSLSAHPNDPPQSFREKYATLQQMKSMGLDPSSPKDRTEYERLKHLRGVR